MKSKLLILFLSSIFFMSDVYPEDESEKIDYPWWGWMYFNPYDLNIQKGKFDLTRVKNFTIEIPSQIDDDTFYFYSFMTVSNGSIVTKFRSGLRKDLEKRQRRVMFAILLNYFKESTKHFQERLKKPTRITPHEVNEFNDIWIEQHPGYIERIICGDLTCSRLDGYVETNPFAGKVDEDVDKLMRSIGKKEDE